MGNANAQIVETYDPNLSQILNAPDLANKMDNFIFCSMLSCVGFVYCQSDVSGKIGDQKAAVSSNAALGFIG